MMINETVPTYVLGASGSIVAIMQSLGYFFILGGGCMLPLTDYTPSIIGDKENDSAK